MDRNAKDPELMTFGELREFFRAGGIAPRITPKKNASPEEEARTIKPTKT